MNTLHGLSESFGKMKNINFPLLFKKFYLETKNHFSFESVEQRQDLLGDIRDGKLNQDYKAKPCLRRMQSADCEDETS